MARRRVTHAHPGTTDRRIQRIRNAFSKMPTPREHGDRVAESLSRTALNDVDLRFSNAVAAARRGDTREARRWLERARSRTNSVAVSLAGRALADARKLDDEFAYFERNPDALAKLTHDLEDDIEEDLS